MRRVWLFGLLLTLASSLHAETLYVSDVLWVTLRAGNGDQFNSLRVMKSGTPLTVLEQGEGEYIKVRTEDGVEGWTQSRYLINEPVAADSLVALEQRFARVSQENDALKERVESVRKEMRETEKERKRLAAESEKLSRENGEIRKVAEKPLELSKANEDLQARNNAIEQELETLRQESKKYRDASARDWFMRGAGVMFGGLLIGLIIPKLRWRRRSDWV